MRRFYYFFIIFCAGCLTAFSQNPEISSELPDVIPPSPTVASLMKFEEVPVNNYTGIPDISIPLFQLETGSKSFDLTLRYHTNSTSLSTVASDVGLGWTVTGLGSISRSVRGLPDEYFLINKSIGIYANYPNTTIGYYPTIDIITNNNTSMSQDLQRFLFDTNQKGIFDTDHDLWQFNFCGHSGRFIIEKSSSGLLEVKLLSDSNLKIINHYITPAQSANEMEKYRPTGFTVFDDLGIRYEFDVIEVTHVSSLTHHLNFADIITTNASSNYNFNSTFHLSRIYDNNNILLLEVDYLAPYEEQTRSANVTVSAGINGSNPAQDFSFIINAQSFCLNGFSVDFLNTLYQPKDLTTSTTFSYGVRKPSRILMSNGQEYVFNYNLGREDDNYFNNQIAKTLHSIEQINQFGEAIKKIELSYIYRLIPKKQLFIKKMFLESLTIENQNVALSRNFYYKENTLNITQCDEDGWGYLKERTVFDSGIEADKDNVSTFALEKMTLPTGGCVIFKYESNTYSHIMDQTPSNFDDNYYNWNRNYDQKTAYALDEAYELFQITNPINRTRIITPAIIPGLNDWWLRIYKDDLEYTTIVGEACIETCEKLLENLPLGIYTFELTCNEWGSSLNSPFTFQVLTEDLKTPQQGYKNYFYGGGYRVSEILTFEDNIDVLDIPLHESLSRKRFYYNSFVDNHLSSGSLNTPKPIKKHLISKIRPYLIHFNNGDAPCYVLEQVNFHYLVMSDNDLVSSESPKTVGYKNVKIQDKNNGYSLFTYSNSMDYPDVEMYYGPPLFQSNISMEYKRGNMLKMEVFRDNNQLLSAEENFYQFTEENLITTGLYVFGNFGEFQNYPVYHFFENYLAYFSIKNNPLTCINLHGMYCFVDYSFNWRYEDFVKIGFNLNRTAIGRSELISKNTRNYFYQGTTTEVLESSEMFEYNPINKKLSKHIVSDIYDDVYETLYFYHSGNSVYSQNRISAIERIESYKNQQLTGIRKINYSNGFIGNSSFLPLQVEVSKGSGALETKVIYERYDSKSHPLQLRQESGIPISYIYAYNNTLPVAKLENIAYNDIPAQLITAIQNATDATNYSESNVLTELEALRSSTDPNMQQAMITTYTHKPLIGISTVTDPRGQRQTYIYDDLNRLKEVRDHNDKLLSENEYYYRTQN